MAQKYSKQRYLNTLLTDFIALLYPEVCIGCGNAIKQSEQMICFPCSIDLPITHYEKIPDNPVEKLFWYKTQIEEATSGYFFSKKSRIQNIIHSFKYKGNSEAAIFMGNELGKMIIKSDRFKTIDLIIPVPLHSRKLKIRGYNQAEKIAEGLSNALDIPMNTDSLIRHQFNTTQTKKALFNRWTSVKSIFEVIQPQTISGKHILLIDDVITSGSTIESCAQQVLNVPKTKVSLASIAVATG